MSCNPGEIISTPAPDWLDRFAEADRLTIERIFRAAVDQGARRPVELLVLVSLGQRLLASNPEADGAERKRARQVLEAIQTDRTAALAFAGVILERAAL